MKRCIACKLEKEMKYFSSDKTKQDGLCPYCKECRSFKRKKLYKENFEIKREQNKQRRLDNIEYFRERDKQYYEKNKEKRSKEQKLYYQENKDKIIEQHKKWKCENKEKYKEYKHKWYEENKEICKERSKINRLNNVENNRKKRGERKKERMKKDFAFNMREKVSSSIRIYIHKNNGSKNGNSIWKYLPYSPSELREHLESQFEPWMNWENYGPISLEKRMWNIDHIIPQSKLPFDSLDHPNFQKCWALENLRPLNALENIRKGNK